MPTVPAGTWVQYSLVGIVLASTILIAGGFYRLWKELLAWMGKQDTKREAERDKQREWEAAQTKQRDAQWQMFLTTMQQQWLQNDQKTNDVLAHLVNKINDLTLSVNDHDTWARAATSAERAPAARRRKA